MKGVSKVKKSEGSEVSRVSEFENNHQSWTETRRNEGVSCRKSFSSGTKHFPPPSELQTQHCHRPMEELFTHKHFKPTPDLLVKASHEASFSLQKRTGVCFAEKLDMVSVNKALGSVWMNWHRSWQQSESGLIFHIIFKCRHTSAFCFSRRKNRAVCFDSCIQNKTLKQKLLFKLRLLTARVWNRTKS